MRRGDVVLVREPCTSAGKARPCVIVQRDNLIEGAAKLTACPLTSTLHGPDGQRPLVMPTPENGLRAPSEVQVDWISSFFVRNAGAVIGRLDPFAMRRIEAAMRRWLDL